MAIALRGIDNDIYFQIGLLTLVGLAAKNAILIVEFAVELNRKEGKSFFDAAAEAARLRLRPIVMTSFAFVLGTLPLAIATGASANSRHSIGTGVIGGTLAATIIAIFFIPMFYWLLGTLEQRLFGGPRARRRSRADAGAGAGRSPGRSRPATQTQARRGCLTCAAADRSLRRRALAAAMRWPAAWSAPTMSGPRSTPRPSTASSLPRPRHGQHRAGGGSSATRCWTS